MKKNPMNIILLRPALSAMIPPPMEATGLMYCAIMVTRAAAVAVMPKEDVA